MTGEENRASNLANRLAFRDDVARLSGASAGPIRVRSFGFCTGKRMPAERTTMRQVREVLRLRTAGVQLNEIARRVGVAPSTVRLTLKRLASAGLSWALPGGDARHRAGGGAVRGRRHEARPSASCRARLR